MSVQSVTRPAPIASASAPFVLPFAGSVPQFATPPAHAGAGAAVLGRAIVGRNARLGVSSVIRADGHYVKVGDDFTLGARSTVHIAHELHPTVVGDRVAVGENAVVHACTLGSDIVVEDGAVILDGSEVPDRVVIDAGSIVFPRSRLESGKLYAGMPARPVRDLRPGEIEERTARLNKAAGAPAEPAPALAEGNVHPSVFVARTARLRGRIVAGENASIWFGCELDANGGEIVIGAGANIQDNTLIRCRPGERFEIGAGSTIGHNVTLADCTIGRRSLIGIGSVVAAGTVVGDDLFLAGGAETTPGQVLESGFLWGKRPAVKMAPLDTGKREVIATTVDQYRSYARAFAEAQRR